MSNGLFFYLCFWSVFVLRLVCFSSLFFTGFGPLCPQRALSEQTADLSKTKGLIEMATSLHASSSSGHVKKMLFPSTERMWQFLPAAMASKQATWELQNVCYKHYRLN
jgi:hypothetical protein